MNYFLEVSESKAQPNARDLYDQINESAFAVLITITLIAVFGLRSLRGTAKAIINSDRAGHFFDTIQQVSTNQKTLEEMELYHKEHSESLGKVQALVAEVHDRIDEYAPMIQTQTTLQKTVIAQLESINATLTQIKGNTKP